MASIKDRKDSEEYFGESPQAIVEKVWGQRAYLRITETIGEGCYLGNVLQSTQGGRAADVLASVVVYKDAEDD